MSDPASGMNVSSLYPARGSRYATELATRKTQLAQIETQIAKLLNSTVESYDILTGGGERQKVERRDVQKLFDRQEQLMARIDFLEMKINGGGITHMNVRRS